MISSGYTLPSSKLPPPRDGDGCISNGCSSTLGLGHLVPLLGIGLGMLEGEASDAVGGDLVLQNKCFIIYNQVKKCMDLYTRNKYNITRRLT